MNEDIIMPDDYQATPSEESQVQDIPTDTNPMEDTAEDITETVETTEEVQAQTEQAKEEARKLKIKYNHQELELGEDEAIPLIQKGMNYEKLQEQLNSLKSDPRLSFVESLAKENNMTVDEYLQAVEQQRYQSEVQRLVEQGISQQYAEEMLENRKFRLEQQAREKAAKEETEKQANEKKQFDGLLDAFKLINNREYSSNDKIPPEVFKDAADRGLSYREAYLEHTVKEMQNQMKILKQNQENKKKAPVGGVTSYGSGESAEMDDFLKGFDSI